jgi:hypothetical protein
MDKEQPRKEEKEMRMAIERACRHVEELIKQEATITLISNNADDGTECQIDEIIEWLFRRRTEDGDKAN